MVMDRQIKYTRIKMDLKQGEYLETLNAQNPKSEIPIQSVKKRIAAATANNNKHII